ncbi:MarR family transcriptional regulator [Tsukamurella asaccharolytica]|uniref:MarR family transcriptional regulator n=1 Tax=Tsukamurella asaccharolytica TaxID=2592067 RepID=A0A5C5R8V5_9ACTN|nr:MarR family transcriptional regulator [Tsukamurella asaccharolytica]TWS19539.1 MarR family transcriptional regulator [Tsukamurella asaccharolytica]
MMRVDLESALTSDVQALSAASDQLSRVFATQHSLSANDFQALLRVLVAERDGQPLTVGRLGRSLRISSAATTYLVDRLIKSGHIRREPHPTDQRSTVLLYDDHGMQVAQEFFGPLAALTHSALATFSDEDLAIAHEVFTVLIGTVRGHESRLS